MAEETPEQMVLLETTPQGVATVTLNRPKLHNAFNDLVIERLADIFDDLSRQDGIRVIVIRGEGPSFSAGGDLAWMRRAAEFTEEQNYEDARALAGMLRTLNECPNPTLALVQGNCFAGGTGVAAACDVAVATRSSLFALTEVRLGLIPATISPYVVAAIGARNARRYFLTAERFNAVEAHRIGLVHELVEDEAGLIAARDRLVAAVLAGAPGAIADAKALVSLVALRPVDDEIADETARRIAAARATPEAREGLAAFFEKRKPSWAE